MEMPAMGSSTQLMRNLPVSLLMHMFIKVIDVELRERGT